MHNRFGRGGRNAHRRWCGWSSGPHPGSPRGGVFGFFVRFGSRFRMGFSFRLTQQILADLFCDIDRNRARVRLLFRDAVPRQKVNDCLGFDLKLTGQLVDSDLVCVCHASF
jgi:hypothetical protein